jgi:hypothetical protein
MKQVWDDAESDLGSEMFMHFRAQGWPQFNSAQAIKSKLRV